MLTKKYKIARIWIKAENGFGLCREGNKKGFESRQVMIACPLVSELKVGLYCRVKKIKNKETFIFYPPPAGRAVS